jgi:hypothetical protein
MDTEHCVHANYSAVYVREVSLSPSIRKSAGNIGKLLRLGMFEAGAATHGLAPRWELPP